MSGRAKTIATTQFAAALMGCTVLAGIPVMAFAQDDVAPETPAPPASAPAPASGEQGQVIRQIAVAGAQRLEPATIVSDVQMRPGQVYTAALADQALKEGVVDLRRAGLNKVKDGVTSLVEVNRVTIE